MKNNKNVPFICFVGIDGSGKTTLAQALIDAAQQYGIKTKYARCRFESFKLFRPFIVVAKKVLLLLGKKTDYSPEGIHTKKQLSKNPFLATIYHYSVLFDYLLQILVKIKLPLLLGKTIVCDRYVYDGIVDMAADFDYSKDKIQSTLKRYLHLLPKPDVVFLIDLPAEIANARGKDDVPSIDYLSERRKIYLDLAEQFGMSILDGCKDLEELKDLVQGRVIKIKGISK